MKTRTGIDFSNYIKSRNKCIRIVGKCIYEKLLARKSKGHPKMFWKYVNYKLKPHVGICPIYMDNAIAITDEDKGNTLNKFFASVFKWVLIMYQSLNQV